MVDHSKYQNDLNILIQNKKYHNYIELMKTIFANIEEKVDIDNFIVMFLNIEHTHKIYLNKEIQQEYLNLLETIRNTIIGLLDKGYLPSQDYLYLYLIYSNFTISVDENIINKINFFKEDIITLEWDNKDLFVENDLIFLFEILQNPSISIFQEYLSRLMLSNLHHGIANNYLKFLENFITLNGINIETVLDTIKTQLNLDIYFKSNIYQRRSLYGWAYELVHNFSLFSYNMKTRELYPMLKDILHQHIKNKEIEDVMFLEFFILILNATTFKEQSEWLQLTHEVSLPCSKLYQNYAQDNNLIQIQTVKTNKIKIAFLFERLIQHSPFKVMYSFFVALMKDEKFLEKYEVTVYSLNYFSEMPNHKETLKKLTDIGVNVKFPVNTYTIDETYGSRVNRALKIRETLVLDQIDIMIACFNSYDILGFLFATRTAPTQIFWSHGGCNYDVVGIDKRISHTEQFCDNYHFESFMISLAPEYLIGTEEEKESGLEIKRLFKKQYGEDTKILGTIGRLVKLDSDDYIKVISQMMQNDPNIIYLACGSGNQNAIKEKLDKYDIDTNKFLFIGEVNAHVYGWVIDAWPDSFPLGQGGSKGEYIAKGGCALQHVKRYQNIELCRDRVNNALSIAKTDNEYIETMSKLLYNKDFEKEVYDSQKYEEHRPTDIKKFLKDIS